jgi:hypothetical protein
MEVLQRRAVVPGKTLVMLVRRSVARQKNAQINVKFCRQQEFRKLKSFMKFEHKKIKIFKSDPKTQT